jgi:hypothetical protein
MSNNKLFYKFSRDLADLILNFGVIFGGYVRDMILHNHHATQYYEKNSSSENVIKEYSNDSIFSEHKDRLVLPSDIDCFMTSAVFCKFQDVLVNSAYFKIKSARICGDLQYMQIPGTFPHGLTHSRLVITPRHNPLYVNFLPDFIRMMKIQVDVLHAHDLQGFDPPFGNVDFEANALIMDGPTGNIRMSKLLLNYTRLSGDGLGQLKKINQIVESITKKEAIPVGLVPLYRSMNMVNKGWCVKNKPCDNIKLCMFSDKESLDMCTICMDDLKGMTQIKADCCNTRYHPLCFQKLVHTNFNSMCPGCRRDMPINDVQNRDVKLW